MKKFNLFSLIGFARILLIDFLGGTTIISTLKRFKHESILPLEDLHQLSKSRLDQLFVIAKSSTKFYKNANNYESLNVLDKATIRQNYDDFISRDFKQKMYPKSTGGSTGIPLNYLTTPASRSAMWAGILMSWEIAGYKWGDKVAFIAGTSIVKSNFKHKLFYSLFNIEVYSVYDLSDKNIENYICRLNKSKVAIIYGYASALGHIANYILRHGPIEFPNLKGIVCTAEVLTENTRHLIQTAFFVPVYNQYGCNEAGVSAYECKYHHLHLISSRSYYEVDMDQHLLSTDLTNHGFIVMKYKTGDMIEFDDTAVCECKSNYPIIKHIMGRTCDIVTDYEGHSLHSCFFNILFRDDKSIKQFQIIFSDTTLKIYLNVNPDLALEAHYEKYITEIKKHLHFDSYKLIFNAPFLKFENAKHRYVIQED